MISHKNKYIFVHIPKCAGTSIEKCLLEQEGYDVELATDGRPALSLLPQDVKENYLLDIESKQHNKLDEYEQDKQKQYFCFTFVRNPWSWAVSDYLYHKKRRQVPTFDIWIQNLTEQDLFRDHMEPQTSFINSNINYIGRVEHINTDWKYITNQLFGVYIKLPEENKCWKQYDYKQFYCAKTREVLANMYKDDIMNFGYTFE